MSCRCRQLGRRRSTLEGPPVTPGFHGDKRNGPRMMAEMPQSCWPMNIQFGLHRIDLADGDQASLIGRVFRGVLECGTRFTQACRIQRVNDESVPLRLPVAAIELVVRRISCYGRDVSALDEGFTGVIEVTGAGLGLITPEMCLIASPPTPDSARSTPRG